MPILNGERIAAAWPAMEASDPRSYLLAFYPELTIPTVDAEPAGPPLAARVNHGSWIVRCECRTPGLPSPGMLLWLAVPAAWCVRCENRAVDGRWRMVALPPDDERAAIEAALDVRPDLATRNWEPWETVETLLAENAAHLGLDGEG